MAPASRRSRETVKGRIEVDSALQCGGVGVNSALQWGWVGVLRSTYHQVRGGSPSTESRANVREIRLGFGAVTLQWCGGGGVNSALQCGWGWGSQCATVRLGLPLACPARPGL